MPIVHCKKEADRALGVSLYALALLAAAAARSSPAVRGLQMDLNAARAAIDEVERAHGSLPFTASHWLGARPSMIHGYLPREIWQLNHWFLNVFDNSMFNMHKSTCSGSSDIIDALTALEALLNNADPVAVKAEAAKVRLTV